MAAARRGPVWRPTPEQMLLLRVVLGSQEEAREAWRAWRARVQLESLDRESSRLLPQVYLALRPLGLGDPAMSKLRGVHRSHWYRNRILAAALGALLRQFERAGIAARLAGGAALALRYYPDLGARPMDDAGIAVRLEQAAAAARCLTASGWRASRPPERFNLPYLFAERSCRIEGVGGLGFELQWSDPERAGDGARTFSSPGDAVALEDGPIAIGGPADLLLWICSRAGQQRGGPAVVWIADAAAVLRTATVDWSSLVATAIAGGLAPAARGPLDLLRLDFDQPIPAEVAAELSSAPVAVQLRLGLWLERAGELGAALARMERHVRRHAALRRLDPAYGGAAGFLLYLRDAYGLEQAGEVPGRVLRSLWRKLKPGGGAQRRDRRDGDDDPPPATAPAPR